MNDRHPSGYSVPADTSSGLSYAAPGGPYYEQPPHEAYAPSAPFAQGYPAGPGQDGHGMYGGYGSYDGYATGTFENLAVSYGDGDPLFGTMPGAQQPPAPGPFAGAAPYPTMGSDSYGTHDAYAGYGTCDTGGYPTTAMWAEGGGHQTVPGAGGTGQWDVSWDTGQWGAGQWDTGQGSAPTHDPAAFGEFDDPGGYGAYGLSAGTHDPYAQQDAYTQQDSYAQHEPYAQHDPYAASAQDPSVHGYAAQALPGQRYGQPYGRHPLPGEDFADDFGDGLGDGPSDGEGYERSCAPGPLTDHDGPDHDGFGHDDPDHDGIDHDGLDRASEASSGRDTSAHRSGPHPSRVRRRPKPRRSALLTVAVPSVCVMGVAGAATASVMGGGQDSDDGTEQISAASADAASSPANKKLDSQLAGLSRGADDFADRASRTQERIDLKQRQAEERARKAKEAARREAMRPKFVLPVKQHGLSATFGQAGVNWMSIHTGIDFPVSYGTPVMSATDGTVTTKHQAAYGNVAIVTMSDGTEILYCHLSSIKIRSGKVEAGDTIAYSGSSGNSTGPHLHFEVRPHGGAAVDPQPWLRARGLNPN